MRPAKKVPPTPPPKAPPKNSPKNLRTRPVSGYQPNVLGGRANASAVVSVVMKQRDLNQVVKEGVLMKKETTMATTTWKERWVRCTRSRLFVYKSQKVSDS